MRVLILDDMNERHIGFTHHLKGHTLFHAYNMSAAQRMLQEQHDKGTPIEMACLDHDLGDEDPEIADFFYDSIGAKKYYTGSNFAYWLSRQDFCPRKILIHSWNDHGAQEMWAWLKNVPGIDITVEPYKAPVNINT
jgi:hypothetical protein